MAQRTGSSAKKQQCGDAAYGNHIGVFGHEEHGKLHRAVFGVVTGDEFGFGFRQVEWRAIGLCVCSHEVNEEGNELKATEEVPAPDAMRALAVDDIAQAE